MRIEKSLGGLNLEIHCCFGGRLIVAPLIHLLLISLRKQLNVMINPLCYLPDQINIP